MKRLYRYLSRLTRLTLIIVALAGVLGVSVVLIAPEATRIVSAHTSVHEQINLDRLPERSIMYDRYGNQLGVLNLENRVPVKLADVSPKLIDAVIAVEDANFYEHKGVNAKSVLRAFVANIDQGGVQQGGSTITQQLVKNTVVGNKRDLQRKLHEAALALELEKQMSKNEILERYLNTIYFGNNAYGVQAAAQTYFNVNAKDLDWAQSAMLAALISNPTDYDPVTRPVQAFRQRALALQRMAETHKMPADGARFANLAPIPRSVHIPPQPVGYFVRDVIDRLLNDIRLGSTPSARYNALFRGGLRIYTTFDPKAQLLAEHARNVTMPGGKGDGTFNVGPDPVDGHMRIGTASIASVEPQTGAVRVLVGGPDPVNFKYDLADNDRGRQAGSSFKPYVLAAGFEQGLVPNDTINGTSPCPGIPGYESYDKSGHPPRNYGGEAGFVGTLTQQTQASSNCAFLRLGQVVGIKNAIDIAKKMGVTHTPLDAVVASAAIGTNNVTPIDMAAAYAVFDNDGIRNPAYLIEKVEDSSGKLLFQHQADPQRVMSVSTARLVTSVLRANVLAGTGTRAQLSSQPSAGKTGTTENATDLWFVGYTPQMATAVWIGAVEGTVKLSFGGGDATGGVYAAHTWGVYMNDLMRGTKREEFPAAPPTRFGKYLQTPSDAKRYGGYFPGSGGGAGGGGTYHTPTTQNPDPGLGTVPPVTTPQTVPPVTFVPGQ